MRFSRNSYVSQLEGQRRERAEVWDSYIVNSSYRDRKRTELEEAEAELARLEGRAYRIPKPIDPRRQWRGPIDDLNKHRRGLELRERIARLRQEIRNVTAVVEHDKKTMQKYDQAINETKSRIREAEQLLLQPELEYRRRCGALDRWDGSWR
ncbi:MAG: hypothetical protein KBA31_19445 [Alphaproteobacteria bacterium]|nr:hypothetical protein [Alphaproteobacteria bacterium]